ncbi:MAG: hypothetical protein ACRD4F_01940, partial [Candidatus Angelobacter sp.]
MIARSCHAASCLRYITQYPATYHAAGNNRYVCFFADEDYSIYLDWLAEQAGRTGCQVHAYV